MARCEQGYLCDVCGDEVHDITESDLYLRFVTGAIDSTALLSASERHIRCNPVDAQFIVDPAFEPVIVEGPFAKANLDSADVRRREESVHARLATAAGAATAGRSGRRLSPARGAGGRGQASSSVIVRSDGETTLKELEKSLFSAQSVSSRVLVAAPGRLDRFGGREYLYAPLHILSPPFQPAFLISRKLYRSNRCAPRFGRVPPCRKISIIFPPRDAAS